MKKEQITKNITVPNKNMEILKKYFSHCFDKNGNFDFEKFKKELSKNEMDFSKESYGMDWLGKSYARLLASDEARTLLKENEEWNKKEEHKNSENLLIKGDNLEVLKHLSNAYYEKIKMIYIDPPYNTGNDGFVYQDDRKFTVEEFSKLAGVDEEKAKRILDFVDSKSNSHSAWLTFMYPRLYIARQLLRDDGVIFVSIDDNEVAQLRILMDEIFGEENFVGIITRVTKKGGNKGDFLKPKKDFIITFFKDLSKVSKENFGKQILIDKDKIDWKEEIFNGKKRRFIIGDIPYREKLEVRKNQRYYIEAPDGTLLIPKGNVFPKEKKDGATVEPQSEEDKCWTWSVDRYLEEKKKGRFYFLKSDKSPFLDENGKQAKWTVYKKIFEDELTTKTEVLTDLLVDNKFENSKGTKELDLLKIPFSNPKPTNLIKYLIDISCNKNDLILDFFAGSGTTGDAVMQLNAEDGGNRKYILVQLDEPIDPKKNKTAYDFVKNELKVENPTIFEITKERLIRAGKKIKEEINKSIEEKENEIKKLKSQLTDNSEKIEKLKQEIENLKNQDLGFKIFETIPIWEDYNFEAEKFDPQLKLFDESKLTEEDLKTLLTTWKTYDGIPLTKNLNEIDLDGYKGYYYENKLYLIHKGFTTKNLKKLLTEIDENENFNPTTIISFGYNFESKSLREIAENVKNYANKKQINIDFIIRY
ncbi:DNA methyltransferase [Methanothermococcus sp. Ax23]|uniref:site-specific DNA-methyltransferase n=1 Tax=Methanothermococcus sp. Ax23 TaxID=3156486 RepID=UPI003B9DD8C8